MWRALKKLYPSRSKAKKFPISVSVLKAIFPLLKGWPVSVALSHNDRLFVTASLIGVFGFLQGGEFLHSKRSSRPVLRGRDITSVVIGDVSFLEVRIIQSKARWWIADEIARCFHCPDQLLNPVVWYDSYKALSIPLLKSTFPAFRLEDGRTLSRDWMVQHTSALLAKAGIIPLDKLGNKVSVLSSSWRAGGVKSAKDSGAHDTTIMSLGRWSSTAWEFYDFTSLNDLFKASEAMHSNAEPLQLGRSLVGL